MSELFSKWDKIKECVEIAKSMKHEELCDALNNILWFTPLDTDTLDDIRVELLKQRDGEP